MMKLKIYKFLGKFIPYFRNMITKKSILDNINREVLTHLSQYNNFIIVLDRLSLVSNGGLHKIKFEITYDIIQFDIYLEFDNGIINETIKFNTMISDELTEINNFYNHFKNIPKQNLNSLFSMLTNAV